MVRSFLSRRLAGAAASITLFTLLITPGSSYGQSATSFQIVAPFEAPLPLG